MNLTLSSRFPAIPYRIGAALWRAGALLSIVAVALTWQDSARAQQRSVDSSSLGGLIDGLRVLQDRGGFPGLSNQGQLLDQSRGQGQGGQSAQDRANPNRPVQVDLTPAERFLVQKFCTDTASPNERDLVPLVTQFSNIEKDFCQRLRGLIFQFGYDFFQAAFAPKESFNGAISDNYLLGIGDELVITLVGQEATSQRVRVDREGRVAFSRLAPISAVGLTMSQFQRELSARANSAFIGTEAFASLGAVRQFSVVVVGEVNRPGIQQVTGFSSILDALGMAGGIKKTGSLRQVRIIRGNRPTQVDLYELLLGSSSSLDIALRDGDRIVVPTLGPTVAVSGDVKRPAIYELPEGAGSLSAADALALGGGAIRPAGAKYIRVTFDPQGRQLVSELTSTEFRVVPGDIVIVGKGENVQLGSVGVAGEVSVPGRRSLQSASTIGAVMRDTNAVKEGAYLTFGVLRTSDAKTLSRRYYALNLRRILDGEEDYVLRDGDELLVLGAADVRFLSSRTVQSIIATRRAVGAIVQDAEPQSRRSTDGQGTAGAQNQQQQQQQRFEPATLGRLESIVGEIGLDPSTGAITASRQSSESTNTQSGGTTSGSFVAKPQRFGLSCESAVALRKLVFETRDGRFSNAIVGADEPRVENVIATPPIDECPEIFEKQPDLLSFVLEHSVNVTGEVRRPGIYPIVPDTGLDAVAAIAGGLTREVDIQRVEVSRFSTSTETTGSGLRQIIDLKSQHANAVGVGPGDVVRFNPLFSDRDSGPVFLSGEFVRPGSYEIRRGERLSEIIARAGGLTAQAYPYGGVFTRERVRRAEQVALQRLARDLNTAVTLAAARRGIGSEAVSGFGQLSRDVANAPATGRVVIEADPTVLQVRPELDVVLEPGDRVFIPKRPNSVLVTGDVLNPGAQQFVSGRRADAYVRLAGGMQRSADSDRVFVILPNGAAQPVGVSAFNFTPVQVPPGSTIVVPKDATPFDLFTFARDISSVLGQLAVTAAALTVISNN